MTSPHFDFLPAGYRGAVSRLPVMTAQVRSVILSTDMLQDIGRADPNRICPSELERRLRAEPDFACAPEDQQDVALLALWLHGKDQDHRSLPSISHAASHRVCELMNKVFRSYPALMCMPGAWNLRSDLSSPGVIAHHLLFLDAKLDRASLAPDLWSELIRQAGATVAVTPGGERHSIAEPVFARSLYNSAAWMCESERARGVLARHLIERGHLSATVAAAMSRKHDVYRRGQVVQREDLQAESIAQMLTLMEADPAARAKGVLLEVHVDSWTERWLTRVRLGDGVSDPVSVMAAAAVIAGHTRQAVARHVAKAIMRLSAEDAVLSNLGHAAAREPAPVTALMESLIEAGLSPTSTAAELGAGGGKTLGDAVAKLFGPDQLRAFESLSNAAAMGRVIDACSGPQSSRPRARAAI